MPPLPHLLLLTALAMGALASCGGAPADGSRGDVPSFQGDFLPLDETDSDPGFAAFAADLRAATAARDTAAFLAMVAPTARLSFGDAPGGPEGVVRDWFAGGVAPSLWETVTRVCAAGFVAEEDAFTAPYAFALWPSDADPFANVAVPGREVEARREPGGEVTAHVSTMILPILAPRHGEWWQVRLPDGQAAYVAAADVVSPLGWRLSVWPDAGGAWKIQSFLSGD